MDIKSKRFLIIDSDQSQLELIQRVLKQKTSPKLASLTAGNGLEAIRFLNREPFDVILLDISIKKISFEKIRVIAHSSKLNRNAYFFFMGETVEQITELQQKKLKIAGLINKPLNESFLDQIEHILTNIESQNYFVLF